MKLPLVGTIAALALTVAATTMAAESNTKETVSGAPDSTVMTQTKQVKPEKKQHKQVQADENTRGRPTDKSAPSSK